MAHTFATTLSERLFVTIRELSQRDGSASIGDIDKRVPKNGARNKALAELIELRLVERAGRGKYRLVQW